MTPERWGRIKEVFHAALELKGAERDAFLDRACVSDPDLRPEVERLLREHRETTLLESPVAQREPSGRTVSHYEVLEKLGGGGMGVVYKARDLKLDRFVALKFLPHEISAEEEYKRRFIHEAKAASALDHNNICTVHEIDETDHGQLFIAMAYYQGETLKKKIQRGPLPLAEVLNYAVQVAQGLAKAHQQGIVHRDIKPANVMVTEDGVVKIVDFGLAQLGDATKLTKTGSTMGTPAYMSPEQIQRQPIDRRTDIWSLGAVLYEMVSGQVPFQGQVEGAVVYSILNEEPEALTALRAGTPTELESIVKRCLAKKADGRYQHVDELLVDLRNIRERMASVGAEGPTASPLLAARQPVLSRQTVFAVAIVAAAVGLTWWLTRPTQSVPPLLTRLTSDPGLTYQPALSSDGTLLAYASDRSGEGNLDIWVQQVGSGSPIRLTDHEADDSEPSFSPDGRTIAFRSERAGGGVYLVPALGGDARLLAERGRRPRFSPNGSEIAFFLRESLGTGVGETYVVASSGGLPRRFQPDFFVATHPVWSPDGQHLIFDGTRSPGRRVGGSDWDWWVAPVDGGEAVRTGAFDLIRSPGVPRPEPYAWLRKGNYVLFSARLGDSTNVWQVPISPLTGQAEGAPQRLTFGTGRELQPAVAPDGRMVFASLHSKVDVWSVPIDANAARVSGELQRLTDNAANDEYPTISEDGMTLVFRSNRSGNYDVRIKDLESGRERALTTTPVNERNPRITADGSKVFYYPLPEVPDQSSLRDIHVVTPQGGVPRKVCKNCGSLLGVSSDGSRIIYWPPRATPPRHPRLFVLNVASGQRTELLQPAEHRRAHPKFSPDSRWIAFGLQRRTEPRRVYVASYRGGATAPESEWIAVTDESAETRFCEWSPDGRVLYFLSDRDGFQCIWARRFDPEAKRAVGPLLEICHLHSPRLSLNGVYNNMLAVARDKIVFSLNELSGNIWLAEPKEGE